MSKTKQEVIEQAYGDHWSSVASSVDENGWCESHEAFIPARHRVAYLKITPKEYLRKGSYHTHWRPGALSGIETNNGWIKIESLDDLPENGLMYKVVHDNGRIGFSKDTSGWVFTDEEGFYASITHYKIYIEDQSPLY